MIVYVIIAIVALAASLACGLVTIPVVLDFCQRKGLYDMPNLRKVHKRAIPRLGGVVFLPSVLIGCVIAFVMAQWQGFRSIELSLWSVYFLMWAAVIYVTGLIDDLVGLSALTKLSVQVVAALFFPLTGLNLTHLFGLFGLHTVPWLVGAALTVCTVVFISNAINLIDGIDGLAGSLSIIALTGFLYCFGHAGMWYFVVMIAAMIGVIAAYLYYNIWGDADRNRKIFMGDTGSLSIGFVLAFLWLKLTVPGIHGQLPGGEQAILTAFTLLIIPSMDCLRVAIVRLLHGQSPIRPDKNHIHHKLLRAGLTHHQTLVAIIIFALAYCAVNALLCQWMSATAVVIIDVFIYWTFHRLLNRRIRRLGEQPIAFV